MKRTSLILSLLLAAVWSHAQTDLDTIQVSASRTSTPLRLALKSLDLLPRQDLEDSPSSTLGDVLEQITSLDLRHRGPMDIQVDPGIRGGTFDQTLILINGVKMTDPQTGHHQMNLPVSPGNLSHVEILETGGSRIYGPNAFSGAIHLHTLTSGPDRLRVSVHGGSYGLASVSVLGQLNTGKWFSMIHVDAARSDGYRPNTDFQQGNAWLQTGFIEGNRQLLIQGGTNAKAFGAQDFYSSRYAEQFEATRTTMVSARYSGGSSWRYMVQCFARQHNDRFELFREGDRYYTYQSAGFFAKDNGEVAVFVPGVTEDWNFYRGHNYHRTRVYGGEASLAHTWGAAGTTSIGVEIREEQILSNVLGKVLDEPVDVPGEVRGEYLRQDARTNLSAFVEHGVELRRWRVNGGLLINDNSAFGTDLLPGLDIGYLMSPEMMVYASADRSFRFPTFTDLYYNLGGAKGSTDLQPEYSINLELGVRATQGSHAWRMAGFRRDGRELIDWVQWKPDSLQAENLTRVIMTGVTLGWTWTSPFSWMDKLTAGYTGMWAESEGPAVPSLYVLDQLRHKLMILARHSLGKWGATWVVNIQDRAGDYVDFPTGLRTCYETIFLVDLRVDYTLKWGQLFIAGCNLLDREYVDRGNVLQPGLWLQGGITVDMKR